MLKGVSLPINLIVIIAIAVLVLVVLAGFFGGFFTEAAIGIQRDAALDQACQEAREIYGCGLSALDTSSVTHKDLGDVEPRLYSLKELCTLRDLDTTGNHRTIADGGQINECLNRCSCPLRSIAAPGS